VLCPAEAAAAAESERKVNTAIVPAQSAGLAVGADEGLEQIFRLAEKLKNAHGFVPEHFKTEGAIAAAILAGRELGLAPMVSLRSLHVVKGKVGLNADMQLALMNRHGIMHKWLESTAEKAVLKLYTKDDPEGHTEPWTIEDAKRANLVKSDSAWQSHPRAMLRARAISFAGRAYCPGIMNGVHTPDEVDEAVERDAKPANVTVAQAVEAQAAQVVEREPPGIHGEALVQQLVTDAPLVPAEMLDQFREDSRTELDMANATAEQRQRVHKAYTSRVVTVMCEEARKGLAKEKLGEFHDRAVKTMDELDASKALRTALWNAFGEACTAHGVHPRSFSAKAGGGQ
jgi:hypothetical protein